MGRTVTLSWNAPSSCTPAGYTLHINQSPDPEGAPLIKDTGVGPNSFQYTFPSDGTYYWHVRACSTCTPYKPGPWATGRIVVSASSGGGVVCSPDPNTVTLYNDGGFSSGCHSYGVGEYGSLGYGLDGQVSSIKDPSGQFHITLFDQPGLRGTPGYFDSDTSQLTGYWNDRAQSMRIEKNRPTSCSPGANGIIAYIGTNYSGGCVTITGDIPDLTSLNVERALNSLRFVGNYVNTKQILLYTQANYQGLCGTYWQNASDLHGDVCSGKAVSVQIRDFTAPTAIPTPPGARFSGNVAQQAYLYPAGTGALVDGDLTTEWTGIGGPSGPTVVNASWAAPVAINHIIVWDSGGTGAPGVNPLTLAFSDGTVAANIDMVTAGPRCADISFPAKSVTWVEMIPAGGVSNSGEGYQEIEIWATTGQQYSSNTCDNHQSVNPTTSSVAGPPVVATSFPGTPVATYKDLVVSAVATESSDGQAHDANNPYILPLDAAYNSVTIKSGAYASANAWNGASGGTVRFTAKGAILIDGTLTVDGKGYRSGGLIVGASGGFQGESYPGFGTKVPQANGGGGGGGANPETGGGGGGYGTAGQTAVDPHVTSDPPSSGDAAYGDPTLRTLYLGSGGGSSGSQSSTLNAAGGVGGGAISITAGSITVHGRISANGTDGGSFGSTNNERGGGGGSGGSILLHADTVEVGSNLVAATGGQGGYGIHDGRPEWPVRGGNGGDGRIRIEYRKSIAGSVSAPAASVVQYDTTTAPQRAISTGNAPAGASAKPPDPPSPPPPVAPQSRSGAGTTTSVTGTPNPLPAARP